MHAVSVEGHKLLKQSTSTSPRLLTIEMAADALACSTKSVRRLVWDGKLPSVRLGTRLRIDLRDLERFIAAHRESVA